MIHIWLGVPLLGGLSGMSTAQSQYADVYDVAVKAHRFSRDGVITRPDPRGQKLRLMMANGEYRQIRCSMGNTAGSSCLFGRSFPIEARVELFEYKGFWMILAVRDLRKNADIVKRFDQINGFKLDKYDFMTITPRHEFLVGFGIGIFITPICVAIAFLNRRRDRILAKRGI
jgi:hypothetical protein